MEWWRKLSVVSSIVIFLIVLVDLVTMLSIGMISIPTFIFAYAGFGMLCMLLYNGQYEGHDCWWTPLGRVLYWMWFPSVLLWWLMMKVMKVLMELGMGGK